MTDGTRSIDNLKFATSPELDMYGSPSFERALGVVTGYNSVSESSAAFESGQYGIDTRTDSAAASAPGPTSVDSALTDRTLSAASTTHSSISSNGDGDVEMGGIGPACGRYRTLKGDKGQKLPNLRSTSDSEKALEALEDAMMAKLFAEAFSINEVRTTRLP